MRVKGGPGSQDTDYQIQELAHNGGSQGLATSTPHSRALRKGFEHGIEAQSDKGGHVKGFAQGSRAGFGNVGVTTDEGTRHPVSGVKIGKDG
ncbi:hypothetical protein PLCT2_01278 [Planctomycetaceae bacterium]|nr:hypothetical protein PLCT2_01278 [Planctomycetaceae bacterium]